VHNFGTALRLLVIAASRPKVNDQHFTQANEHVVLQKKMPINRCQAVAFLPYTQKTKASKMVFMLQGGMLVDHSSNAALGPS